MVKMRKTLSMFTGALQCVIGTLATVLAFLVYTSLQFQEMLLVTGEEITLVVFLLSLFGLFSIVSGLFLVWERKGEY